MTAPSDLEAEWDAFQAWRGGPVDEVWKQLLLAKIKGEPPGVALGILQDAYNRALVNRATMIAAFDEAADDRSPAR